MKEADFQVLCQKVSEILKLKDVHALAKERRTRVDGTEICVIFDEKTDPNNIHCYVDMGHPNPQKRVEIYEELLRAQLFLAHKYNAVFGIDPISENCVLVCAIPATKTPDPKLVAERLNVYAAQGKLMTHFMANGTPQAAVPLSPHTPPHTPPHPTIAAATAKPRVATPAGASAPAGMAHGPKTK